MRSGTVGAIELSSRDDENYNGVEVNISGANAVSGRHGSEERILGPNSNITKTVVVEMKSEQLK